MVKSGVVYPNIVSLIASMLHSLQIIGPILKSVSACLSLSIFPYLKAKKDELGCPNEQYSLIVMDTFKGQDNSEMKELCSKNEYELVIVFVNLTNKFQPIDITNNRKAKKFISHKFNICRP